MTKLHSKFVSLVLLASFFMVPLSVDALSCEQPDYQELTQKYLSDYNYYIFYGTVVESFSEDVPEDWSWGGESYISKQRVEVSESIKSGLSQIPDEILIRYHFDSDWGYGCDPGPRTEEEKQLFAVRENHLTGTFTIASINEEVALEVIEDTKSVRNTGVKDMTDEDRAQAVMERILSLVELIKSLVEDYRFWQGR